MITEAIASYYASLAERWMVSREGKVCSQEFPSRNVITLQDPFEKRTAFSRFVVPKNTDTKFSFRN